MPLPDIPDTGSRRSYGREAVPRRLVPNHLGDVMGRYAAAAKDPDDTPFQDVGAPKVRVAPLIRSPLVRGEVRYRSNLALGAPRQLPYPAVPLTARQIEGIADQLPSRSS